MNDPFFQVGPNVNLAQTASVYEMDGVGICPVW